MGMIWSRESEFGRASSGPTSLRHRATGSKRTRQTRARPGRQTGCRTSYEFANRRFVLSHECPHLRIEIWGTPGQIWATRQKREGWGTRVFVIGSEVEGWATRPNSETEGQL